MHLNTPLCASPKLLAKSLKILILLVIHQGSAVCCCFAQEGGLNTFKHPLLGFSISYPPELKELPGTDPRLPLILRHSKQNFPNFNIVVEPGSYETGAPLAKQDEEVLHSYRLVGITDVKKIRSSRSTISGRAAFTIELSYRYQDQTYRSAVNVVPGTNGHFILTYIDREASFEGRQGLHKKLVESFKVFGEEKVQVVKKERGRFLVTVSVVLLVGGIIGFLCLRKRGRKGSGSS